MSEYQENKSELRIVYFRISSELFFDLIKSLDGKKKLKLTGIPQDATMVKASYDLYKDEFVLFIKSESFAIKQMGAIVSDITGNIKIEEIKDVQIQNRIYEDNEFPNFMSFDLPYLPSVDLLKNTKKDNTKENKKTNPFIPPEK